MVVDTYLYCEWYVVCLSVCVCGCVGVCECVWGCGCVDVSMCVRECDVCVHVLLTTESVTTSGIVY